MRAGHSRIIGARTHGLDILRCVRVIPLDSTFSYEKLTFFSFTTLRENEKKYERKKTGNKGFLRMRFFLIIQQKCWISFYTSI